MPALKVEPIIFLNPLVILSACGDTANGDNTPQSEEERLSAPDSFSTRLRNNLLISGEKCRGGETSESNGQIITCNAGQYFIAVDDINTCDGAGRCTEVGIFTVSGEIRVLFK
ncbi:MAG: hypothetical protein H0V66_02460 [Bdellovibrionales bacterium]|nr:hypothetical protein [Bdellovibrionales bacterium]